ncbi:hypothetical protein [Occallatibacter riparius]|uniref:Adenylate cyclase n=1 Tax=Occallatibacter riparius TaxID=1002689 RepID=A0A9J7BR94_9BACT|nr:hypothetical protein [Occallatibacter riparius]UWZ85396.1 hypothetical protein MOP44_05515 [Occallatibacter riparius]
MKNLMAEVVTPLPPLPGESEAVSASEVQTSLADILQSSPFRSSPQLQKLLKFLVGETLAGRGESLKERNIGVRLFDRCPDYDTNVDPIVRLRVAEVRKRLALFYQGVRDQTVLISIPSGSFRAVFEPGVLRALPAGVTPMLTPEPIPVPPQKGTAADVKARRFRFRRWWIAVLASLLLMAAALVRYLPSSDERLLNRFWSPVLENPNSVLIGIGNNPIYELSNAGEDEYYKDHPKGQFEEMGLHPYIPLAPESSIDSRYLRSAVNTYLTTGDAAALSDVEYILAQRRIKLDMRFVNDVTYGDLRQNPTILIGAHNNIWTLTMTENLRFGFQGHSTIVDRFDRQKQWTANADRSETYAIAARLLNAWNGKVMIVIGGVGSSATRAAGDFITNPHSIAKMAMSLPKGWEKKNIEVVLHTTVKNQIPSTSDIVAIYSW